MAKPQRNRKSRPNDAVTVSKIYEILKSHDFLQELWWDLIADIKEKPTYKRIKGLVNDVIHQRSIDFSDVQLSETQRLQRKTLIAEISIMAFTVDTIISQILHKKLQSEFHSMIADIIEELKGDKKINSNRAAELVMECSSLQAAASNTNRDTCVMIKTEESDEESDISVGRFSVSSVHTSELSSFDDAISISSGDEESGKEKKKISLKDANEKYLNGKLEELIQTHRKRGKPRKLPKNAQVSISFAKENNKASNEKYLNGKVEELDQSPKKRGRPCKLTEDVQVSKSSAKENNIACASDPIARKTLPERVRKPNSRYTSESIICPIRQFSSSEKSLLHASPRSSEEQEVAAELPRKRKRPTKMLASVDYKPQPTNLASGNPHVLKPNISTEEISKERPDIHSIPSTSTKRYESADLYKPRRVFGSTLASRGSPAVVLHSSCNASSH